MSQQSIKSDLAVSNYNKSIARASQQSFQPNKRPLPVTIRRV